ncbi:hypothetical protein K8Q96_01715 [Candidatus Nomurabacteria bacterium]|nr:hypothetical protein [Candidatus Nomurabacteria bacterium]
MDENKKQINNSSQNVKTLRTYSSDMADAIRDNEMSVIKIALAEKDKQSRNTIYRNPEETNIKKILLLIGGAIFIVGAIVGIYFIMKKNTENIAIEKQIETQNNKTFIPSDNQVVVDATTVTDINGMSKLIRDQIIPTDKIQSIKLIFVNKDVDTVPTKLELTDFLSTINTTASGSLIRSLSNEYLIGTYQDSVQTPSLFFMFETKNYNQTYPGMLDWEKTMINDLSPFFNIDILSANKVILDAQFKDLIIANKDTRVLYDQNGKGVLYYAFVSKDKFIITDNINTIKKIISILQTQ